jgi:hypothetical protein
MSEERPYYIVGFCKEKRPQVDSIDFDNFFWFTGLKTVIHFWKKSSFQLFYFPRNHSNNVENLVSNVIWRMKINFFKLHCDFFKIVFVARLVELTESFQNMSSILALDKVLRMKNYQ